MNVQQKQASPAAIWAAMIVVYIVWGSTYLAIRFAVETIPPLLMASSRFLLAGGILYAWRRLSGDPAPTFRQWRSAGVIGLFLLLGGNGLVSWAEQTVPSGITALLVGTTPLWFVLIDSILQRRAPRLVIVLGVIVGFIGIALLVNPWQDSSTAVHLPGALAVVLAASLWASGSLYSRKADLPSSPLLGTSMEMLIGGAALVLVGTLTGEWARVNPGTISLNSVLGVLYLVVFGSLLAYSAYTWLLRNAPTPLVATYAYVNPLVAILLGNLMADEPITARVLLAAAIILSAVVLITRNQPARRIPAEEVEGPALNRIQQTARGDD